MPGGRIPTTEVQRFAFWLDSVRHPDRDGNAGSDGVAVALADAISQLGADRDPDAGRIIHSVGDAGTAGRGDGGFGRHEIPDLPQAG